MSKNYKLQCDVNEVLYEKWKTFLYKEYVKPHGRIMNLNAVAIEIGITTLMQNPKLLHKKMKEMEDGN